MINILPESGRSTVTREYRIRLAAMVLFLLAFLSIVTAAMLMPSYLFATVASEQASQEEARLSAAKSNDVQSDTSILLSVNKDMSNLEVFMSTQKPSEIILSILQSVGAGVELTRVSYNGTIYSSDISGKASTRDALLSFSKAIQKLPLVVSADLPVGDLAKSSDVSFGMTLSLKK